MRDIALDPLTGDIDITNRQIKYVTGADYVRQKLYLRLGLHRGEWFNDTSIGIPYDQILKKAPDMPAVESMFRSAIATCPGVAALESFQLVQGQNRTLILSFSVRTTEGDVVTVSDFVASGL